jgi:hypothetical protein
MALKILIPGYSQYQHYKARRPAWIKLHRKLLENYKFMQMKGKDQMLLLCLWVLAADEPMEEDFGVVKLETIEELGWRLRGLEATLKDHGRGALDRLKSCGFIELSESASSVLASRKRNGVTERETERETETERENSLVELGQDHPHRPEHRVFLYWRERTGHGKAQWSEGRRRILAIRLGEEPGDDEAKIAGLKLAVEGALLDPMHNGSKTGTAYLGFENIFKHQGRDRIEKLQAVARAHHEGVRHAPAPSAKAKQREDGARALVEGGLRGGGREGRHLGVRDGEARAAAPARRIDRGSAQGQGGDAP